MIIAAQAHTSLVHSPPPLCQGPGNTATGWATCHLLSPGVNCKIANVQLQVWDTIPKQYLTTYIYVLILSKANLNNQPVHVAFETYFHKIL